MPNLAAIDNLLIDDLIKGLPGGARPCRLAEIGERRWNVLREDLPLPLAVISESALAHNERWMAGFLRQTGAIIAPHGKTTMSPQLFRRQLDYGAWAITVATAQQIQVCRRFGFERILLANQLVGRQAIRYVLDELARDPGFQFYCLVDSIDGVALLDAAARERDVGRPLNVFVEGGVAGGRTGCRSMKAALAVAHAVNDAAPRLALAGVEGFEGLIEGENEEAAVCDFLAFLAAIAEACDAEDLFDSEPVFLSAGGSAFYDLVVKVLGAVRLKRKTQVLTRSGCYITHDSGMYVRALERLRARSPDVAGLGEGPRPALEVWAYVQSRPEAGKAILNIGRRDVSHDADLPTPLAWYRPGRQAKPQALPPGHRIVALNDQHAHLKVPEESLLAVGDMVACGISHPCTTFDKWRVLFVVDDDYTITSALATYF